MCETKLCPFCSEEIKATAIKCKHCGSMLDGAPAAGASEAPGQDGANLIGRSVLGYRIEEEIGSGGMGTVYRGINEALGQRVAIKVLDPALSANPEIRQRFIQEARIQIGLKHPGIVQVLTADTAGEQLALLMEYVDGLSLDQVIARRGRLPFGEALAVFKQALAAVGYAHTQTEPIVHRDLKPSNIMVQADGTTKVMDFGIAKVMGGAKLTRTGTVMGSPHYMSPEQVLGQQGIDHRSDIYSLGITLYEMLCGRTPFEGAATVNTDSDYLIKDAHVRQPPPSPAELRADIPEHVVRAILRALRKEPQERFGSCSGFAEALSRSVTERHDKVAPQTSQPPWIPFTPRTVGAAPPVPEPALPPVSPGPIAPSSRPDILSDSCFDI